MSKTSMSHCPWSAWSIEEPIGAGSFGTVYKAVRTDGLSQAAAVKYISIPDSQEDIDEAVKKVGSDPVLLDSYFKQVTDSYTQEIIAMSKLKGNTNIVSYEDHIIEKKADGVGYDIYIRMELLRPFETFLKEHQMTDKEIAKLGVHMCTALELCSAEGLIHGDIKPSNIYVSKNGNFKLGDFGSATLYSNIGGKKTTSGGTPAYMAPELRKKQSPPNEKTDIYSLGLVMYQLLNQGRLPFVSPEGEKDWNLQLEALKTRDAGTDVPPPQGNDIALNSIILKALQFQPENRYGSAREFRERLSDYLRNAGDDASYEAPAASIYETQRATPSAAQSNAGYAYQMSRPIAPTAVPAVPPVSAPVTAPVSAPVKPQTNAGNTMNTIVICATLCIISAIVAAIVVLGGKDKSGKEETVASETVSQVTAAAGTAEAAEAAGEAVSSEMPAAPNPENIVPVASVSCSGNAGKGKYNRSYSPNQAVDGNPATCWMAYGTPAGAGSWIKLTFHGETAVNGVEIINGNTWDGVYNGSFISGYEELYEKNGRLRDYVIELSDGSRISGTAYDVSETRFKSNIITFEHTVQTSYVKLYVKSGYKGYKYPNNVCIGEIQAFC